MNGLTLSFAAALLHLKAGSQIARVAWADKGTWLYLVPGSPFRAQTAAAKAAFGDYVPYQPYIAQVTEHHNVVPWVATQTDILTDDWVLM